MLIGLSNGLIIGLFSFVFVFLYLIITKPVIYASETFSYTDALFVSGITSISMFAAIAIASLIGTLFPLILNKLKIDIRYIFNMFINNKNKKDFLRTIKNYYRFKKNKNLENYLNFEMKSEMSLHIMCNSFINEIKKYDDKDET